MMIPNLSQGKLTYIFIEGLKDSIKALVKPFEPQTLEEAIRKAKKIESNTPKERPKNFPPKSPYQNYGTRRDNRENYVLLGKNHGTKNTIVQEKKNYVRKVFSLSVKNLGIKIIIAKEGD